MNKSILLLLFSLFSFNLQAQYSYIENPRLYQENKEPAKAFFIFDTQEEVRDITTNKNYLLLNGNWKFSHANTPEERIKDFYKADYDVRAWAEIPVPGNWQMYGYDYPIYTNWKYPFKADKPKVPRDFNPVGAYKTTFTLNENWQAKQDDIILHFGGVNSCFFVWLNGEYLGYSEDSKLPSEFKVSKLLKKGENQLAVEVYKYCDGTYLEDQDMWRLSGIERDVFLYKQAEMYVRDLTIISTLDTTYTNGLFSVDFLTNLMSYAAPYHQIICTLKDKEGQEVWRRFEGEYYPLADYSHHFYEGVIPNVHPWSAQDPYRYTLQLVIRDEAGNIIQKIDQKVGFKKLEIKEGVFYINGDMALIKGVNRHEHDADWGHAVGYSGNVFSLEDMRKDLVMIKSLNFNAIRTAHYPNHPAFYDLCDELGLYVCDEANIEAHWYMMFKPFNNITKDEDYQEAILSRIHNMYQRDKNHPSIIMWSVGNENGTGPTMVKAYKMLKELDEERPVFNERHFFLNTIGEKHSDFNGNMYAPIEKVKKIIDKDHDKPFIWIEYAHAMGNSTGNFKDLWDFVRSEPQVQGGFMWDWRDQGIWTTNEKGEKYLGYGGHFEPNGEGNIGGVQGDGNFCANGVISADGKLHPAADAIQHVQSNIQIERLNDTSYRFINDFEDVNLSEFQFWLNWKHRNGKGYFASQENITCQPMSDTIVQIKPQGQIAGDISALLIMCSNGSYVYRKNFFFKEMQAPEEALTGAPTNFKVSTNQYGFEINNEQLSFLLTNKGKLDSLIIGGQLKFLKGPQVNFWRASTDNDYGNKAQKRLVYWKTAAENSTLIRFEHQQVENYYFIQTRYELAEKKGIYTIDYKIYADGVIQVKLDFDLRKSKEIPRIGSYMVLPKEFDVLRYYGLGPNENYIDRQEGQWFFEHYLYLNKDSMFPKLNVQEMPYIRPQEYGNRMSTYLINLYTTNDSLRITGIDLSFSAWTHSQDDIDEGMEKQGKTILDIPKRNYIWLNIDHAQMGLGGDNSWGRKPYDKYLLKGGAYSYAYTISPK